MEDNKDMVSSTETEQVEETTKKTNSSDSTKSEKMYTRAEVEKIKANERKEIEAKYQAEKSEAEKLAKMDVEQKLNYELEQKAKENEDLKNQLNSLTLKSQASSYANEKGLPIGYIEDWDFAKETADSVKEKIDKLSKLRSNDLEGYLKDKLKQQPPKAVDDNSKSEDPYIQGFKNYMNSNKKK